MNENMRRIFLQEKKNNDAEKERWGKVYIQLKNESFPHVTWLYSPTNFLQLKMRIKDPVGWSIPWRNSLLANGETQTCCCLEKFRCVSSEFLSAHWLTISSQSLFIQLLVFIRVFCIKSVRINCYSIILKPHFCKIHMHF